MLSVGNSYSEARNALRAICSQPLLNWREARFHGRYGEVELHLLEFLCRRKADAIDVGAHDGSYVHYLRRYARHVVAYEPTPALVEALRHKFPCGVTVQAMALSEVPMQRLDDVYSGDVGFIKIDVGGHEQAVLDGAVETIKRCQPRLLVEVDDRLSPGGLGRARAYFDRLGYRGLFVHRGQLKPVERFSIQTMQDAADLPDPTAPLHARQRFGRYIYNFIFLPPDELQSTVWRMTERLRALAA